MKQLKATIEVVIDINDLASYPECETVEDAAAYTQDQLDCGEIGVEDIIQFGEASCRVEALRDDDT